MRRAYAFSPRRVPQLRPEAGFRWCLSLAVAFSAISLSLFSAPGDPDPNFGFDGIVTDGFGTDSTIIGLLPSTSGTYLVGGHAANDFLLARYQPNGVSDLNFATSGFTRTDFGGNQDVAYAMALKPPGFSVMDPSRVLIAGMSYATGGGSSFALALYDPLTGALDSRFGTGGKVTTDVFPDERLREVIVQVGGPPSFLAKFVAAGDTSLSGGDFLLVRYSSNGSLDSTFGTGGIVTTDFFGGSDSLRDIVGLSGGKVAAGGYGVDGGNLKFVVSRYLADGGLDTSFGGTGKVVVSFPGVAEAACDALVNLPGGKIMAIGKPRFDTPNYILFAVLNDDGSMDESFAPGGIVMESDPELVLDNINTVLRQSDGKIVIAGQRQSPIGDILFALSRYRDDGSADPTFGDGGLVLTNFANLNQSANALAVRANGTLLAGGSRGLGPGQDFAMASYRMQQGDGRVGRAPSVPLGNDRYSRSPTGQTQKVVVKAGGGGKKAFTAVQNDGAVEDSFRVRATRGNRKFGVKYLAGGNITAQLVRGNYQTPPRDPGALLLIQSRIVARTDRSGKRRNFSILSDSLLDPDARDHVRIQARAR